MSELEKPGGTLCAHCAPGKGCAIYAERPLGCRTFECVWLMDPEMPHRFRPDQTRVVLDQDGDGKRLFARCDPANPMAWKRNPMYAALKGYAADNWGKGKIVMAVAGKRTWLVLPKEDIYLGEIDPGATISIVQTPEGVVEVKVGDA